MPDTLGALYIIVLLLPGFVGYLALVKVYNRKIEDAFDKTAFTVLITSISLAVIGVFHRLDLPLSDAKLTGAVVEDFFFITFPVQSAICLVIGAVMGWIGNSAWVSGLANRFGFSAKTGQAAVIAATIQRYPDSFFRFRFKDGSYVVGHPMLYPLDGDEVTVFLEKAAYRRPRANAAAKAPRQIDVDGPGALIVSFDEILFVELI